VEAAMPGELVEISHFSRLTNKITIKLKKRPNVHNNMQKYGLSTVPHKANTSIRVEQFNLQFTKITYFKDSVL